MAHVYDGIPDLTVYANPAAIAAGYVYLKDFLKDADVEGSDCRPSELLADMPGIVMQVDGLAYSPGGYWLRCKPHGSGGPPQEAIEVFRSVFVDREVPQWFYDTYQQADGSWNLEAIKETRGYYADDTTYRQLRHLIPEL